MFKVRFHLAKGKHFMYWQVKDSHGNVDFFDPEKNSLILTKATLINRKATAQRIYQGENKTVCAWVQCDHFSLVPPLVNQANDPFVSFNPRVAPFWRGPDGSCIDGHFFLKLYTTNRSICAILD